MDGGITRASSGPQAKAILIMDHAVDLEEDLLQPDAGTVIYVQTPENRWKMFPRDAPLLDRYLILAKDTGENGRMSVAAQAVDASKSGSTCGQFTR